MTIRTSAPITLTPGSDFFRADRGITWGIKVTVTGDAAIQGLRITVHTDGTLTAAAP